MSEARPPIPRSMRRDLLVEAGHRCAIPTCRSPVGLQIHHIVDWAKVKEHTFVNLIVLCSNCHSRVTNREIDTLAVQRYKANLSVLNHRYGDIERRVLEYFALTDATEVAMTGNHTFDLMYLVRDGLLVVVRQYGTGALPGGRTMITKLPTELLGPEVAQLPRMKLPDNITFDRADYRLTDKGREFVANWLAAEDI